MGYANTVSCWSEPLQLLSENEPNAYRDRVSTVPAGASRSSYFTASATACTQPLQAGKARGFPGPSPRGRRGRRVRADVRSAPRAYEGFPVAPSREKPPFFLRLQNQAPGPWAYCCLREAGPERHPGSGSKTKPGEKGFAVVVLIFGAGVLWQGILMFQKSPKISSYGAMPLFLGALLVFLSILNIAKTFKRKSTLDSYQQKEKFLFVVRHLFSRDVFIMIIFLILYCLALFFNFGFVVSTSVYLLVSMHYLTRKKIIACALYTAAVMLFVMFVFKIVFKVVLP